MAKAHDLIRTTSDNNNKPSSSSSSSSNFLCCFGFSQQRQPKESITTVDHKKRDKMSVRLRFSFKTNRSSVKTVPVLADSEPEREREINPIPIPKPKPKPKSKSKSKPNDQLSIVTVVPTTPDHKKTPRRNPLHQNNNLDNRKYLAQSNTSIDDTCLKRLSFSRKIDAIRTGSSQPGSPLAAKPSKPVRTMKHSESFPSRPNRIKPRAPAGRVVRKRFEPLVGMSVVMVTLVIMLMWGRLCAILCTSAWLYFLPRLSTAVVDPDIGRFGSGLGSDLGSEESKKKVVFEGFLERNNYNNNNHRNL